jgi:hypothetical protein
MTFRCEARLSRPSRCIVLVWSWTHLRLDSCQSQSLPAKWFGRGGRAIVLDVYEFVHRGIITKTTNKMQQCGLIYYSKSAVHVLGHVFAHHQEHLTVFTASGNIHQCHGCVGVLTHPWRQPAETLLNITRFCKYSQVLLMMDENIARNI